jgi:cysteine synthase
LLKLSIKLFNYKCNSRTVGAVVRHKAMDQLDYHPLPDEETHIITRDPPGTPVLPRTADSFRDLSPNKLLPLPREERFRKIAEVIGHTPVFAVPELSDGSVMQKYELFNPSGSHYDRAYLPTVQYLENEGLIRPGDELRDITSGSAGISLALMGSLLGYRIRVTVPDELPEARVLPMKNLHAEVVRCGPGYIKAASDFQAAEIKELIRHGWRRIRPNDREMRAIVLESMGRRICYVNHSENLLTPESFAKIGHEIVQLFEWERITPPAAVVLAMGNFTTIAGISPVMRDNWPETEVIGFEGASRNVHDNYGTTVDGVPLRFKDEQLLDRQVIVTNKDRDTMDKRVNTNRRREFQLGNSSLMGLVVAEKVVSESPGSRVVSIAYDQKYRY